MAEKNDPTKDAFFSDLMDNEEEFASEAYELVEHAINLIDSQFYDDGIEILRQAIGLYTQINREEEINAVNEKISEVYLLKEKTYLKKEIQAEIVIEDELKRAEQLIRRAKESEERQEFEVALNIYDEVENIFEQLDAPDKTENLYNLIEDCYNKKAEFLRTIKVETPESKALVPEDELKEDKIQEFLTAKKREEEVASQAYEILTQAAKLVNNHEYEHALKLYDEGLNLFKKINWTYEIQKIEETIIELEKEKVEYFRNLEKQKVDKAQKIEIQMQQEEIIEQQLREREEQKKTAKIERLKELEFQKMEEDFFKIQLSNMATAASKIARDYELAMQKSLKEGRLVEKCVYPQVIEIYKKIKKLLIEKGWNSETEIYDNTIEIYNQKLEQDKKVRQIEAEKVIKQKETVEMLKIKKEEKEVSTEEKQLKTLDEEQHQREIEIQNLRKNLDDIINRAERLSREYEVALRQGKFELKSPYPEIIKIYEKTRQTVLEKRMNTEVAIFTSQINTYIEKMQKDKRLRQIEADKIEKQKKAPELLKVGKRGKSDTERLKNIERKKEQEEFRNYISGMIDKTEKIARDYELAKRKAFRKGEIIKNTPYLEVIEKYKQIRDQVQDRGWNEQAKIYDNQIKIYQEKLEKHKKLFEVEAKKAQRQKDIEDMHKVKKVFKPEKVKEIEPEHKEENMLIDNAMGLIDEAEKNVKSYELILKRDILSYESPYEKAIDNYEKAQELFRKIDWKNEAHRLNESIKFYKEKKEKDDILRDKEQKKLVEPIIEKIATKTEPDKEVLERKKEISEFEQKKKEIDETASEIFSIIQNAEHMAQEYELKIKAGIFDNEAPPYEKIIDIYREASKRFEEINWKEESTKLLDSIKFYKEKLEKDKKIRFLEAEKVKQREEELLTQQKLLEKARIEQEKLLKEKQETELLRRKQSAQFETQKDKAFRFMDRAKHELNQNNFKAAIELYKESETIFVEVDWQEGIAMIRDSIIMIRSKQQAFELEKKREIEIKKKTLILEEKFEKELSKTEEIRTLQKEEKRKELQKIQREKEQESNISKEAYKLLEQGTALLERNKFDGAYEKYIAAREIFQNIAWKREISRINNDLLFILKRKRKKFEILKDTKKKEAEDAKKMEMLKEETKLEQQKLEKRKKEKKRRLAKEKREKKIVLKLEQAKRYIEDSRYNEGILFLKEEIGRLTKLGKQDEITKINEQINDVKHIAQIPLVTLEESIEGGKFKNFESAYKALDKAQINLANNRIMKAVSELNEAKFNLKVLKIGNKYIKEIDTKINELKVKLGQAPSQEIDEKEKEEKEKETLQARIAFRREERRKKVLNLLKKSID